MNVKEYDKIYRAFRDSLETYVSEANQSVGTIIHVTRQGVQSELGYIAASWSSTREYANDVLRRLASAHHLDPKELPELHRKGDKLILEEFSP
ncbi:MAG: hypothetical protein AABX73_00255 [Nanoarchaeota archaeon]